MAVCCNLWLVITDRKLKDPDITLNNLTNSYWLILVEVGDECMIILDWAMIISCTAYTSQSKSITRNITKSEDFADHFKNKDFPDYLRSKGFTNHLYFLAENVTDYWNLFDYTPTYLSFAWSSLILFKLFQASFV